LQIFFVLFVSGAVRLSERRIHVRVVSIDRKRLMIIYEISGVGLT